MKAGLCRIKIWGHLRLMLHHATGLDHLKDCNRRSQLWLVAGWHLHAIAVHVLSKFDSGNYHSSQEPPFLSFCSRPEDLRVVRPGYKSLCLISATKLLVANLSIAKKGTGCFICEEMSHIRHSGLTLSSRCMAWPATFDSATYWLRISTTEGFRGIGGNWRPFLMASFSFTSTSFSAAGSRMSTCIKQ